MRALADIIDYTDVFAVSMYPFMSAFMTSTLPDDLFTRLAALSEGKPMAISETGFPAQTLDLPSFGLNMPSDEAKQHAFITRLLAAATEGEYLFIINFVLRDYDQLWEQIGGGDVNAIWRDTGLYDENGTALPALEAWRTALARPYTAPDASP
jgi:exo-beta-1,3-glucanase (GH17 family)